MNYGRSTNNTSTNTTESTATGPRAKCDQVVFEALCKACEIIVASRSGDKTPVSSAVSSRFNLTLPEHASVRQILQKWRRALHLPLRLDVYYQHSNNDNGSSAADGAETFAPQRELLERWCLVYAPPSSEEWMQYQQLQQQKRSGYSKSPSAVSLDPIVQLRQVCKKIVVWLRTLYCFARLLPATSFLHSKSPNVGFSLYAIAQGTEDDVQLQQQGFLCHPASAGGGGGGGAAAVMQPSYVVGTPYGVLTWKVVTAEASVIHRLTGRSNQQAWNLPSNASHAVSRAIPIYPRETRQHNNKNGYEEVVEDDDEDYQYYRQQNHNGTTAEYGGIVPQSAPAHLMVAPWQQQQGQQQQQGHGANQPQRNYAANVPPPKTYQQPSQFRERMAKVSHPVLQRRHTSIGNESAGIQPPVQDDSPKANPAVPAKDQTKRVLSGLSLAMMTLEEQNNHEQDGSAPTNGIRTADDSKEKRRAALHQAPPHRRPAQDDSAATTPPSHHHHQPKHYSHLPQKPTQTAFHRDTSQEYGYAYNNHIPWQKIHPSTNHPSLQQRGEAEDSPGRGPATPSVLGSTPPPMLLNPGSQNSSNNPSSFGKQFLPPRSGGSGNTTPLTPPFANRPTGFVVTTPDPPQALPTYSGGGDNTRTASPLQARPDHFHPDAMPQPLTSLDLLHQSPFLWNPNPHGSMLSSMTMPGDSNLMDLKRSLLLTHHQQPSNVFTGGGATDWAEEMPFAVEDAGPTTGATAVSTSGNNTTNASPSVLEGMSSLGASTAVASLAQKCATSQRLQLFESSMSGDGTTTTDALVNQLADFRAFGASLMVEGTASSSSSVVTNTTPTALRT